MDKDGDGRIDYQEFCDMMRGQACYLLFLPWHKFPIAPDIYLCKTVVKIAVRNATLSCRLVCLAGWCV